MNRNAAAAPVAAITPLRAMAWEYWRVGVPPLAWIAVLGAAATAMFHTMSWNMDPRGMGFVSHGFPDAGRFSGAAVTAWFSWTAQVALLAVASFSYVCRQRGPGLAGLPVRWHLLPIHPARLVLWQLAFALCGGFAAAAVMYLPCLLVEGLPQLPSSALLLYVVAATAGPVIVWGLPGFRLLRVAAALALFVFWVAAMDRMVCKSLTPGTLAAMVAVIAASFGLTLAGACLDRRGLTWFDAGPLLSAAAARMRVCGLARSNPAAPPFASAAQAQFWHDWRSFGIWMPILSACGAAAMVAFNAWAVLSGLHDAQPVDFEVTLVTLWFVLPAAAYFVTLVTAERGRSVGVRNYRLPVYLGTRPMSDARLAGSALAVAALSSALSVAILFAGLLLCVGPERLFHQQQSPMWAANLAAVSFLLTFGMQAVTLTLALCGRAWPVALPGLAVCGNFLVIVAMLAFGKDRGDAVHRVFLAYVGLLAAAATAAAAWATLAGARHALIGQFRAWGVVAAIVVCAGLFVVSVAFEFRWDHWLGTYAFLAALAIASFGAAPYAVSVNRRR